MNVAKILGFIVGICVVALLLWAMSRRLNTDGSTKTEYDERQKAARGVGYMYGFYTLMAYFAILIAVDCMEVTLPVSNTIIYFTGIVVSGLVLTWYCIMHDAYWGMNNNVSFYTRFLLGVGGINLVYAIIEMVNGKMIVDGILQNTFINFECGILIAGIGIMLFIKSRKDRKEGAGAE